MLKLLISLLTIATCCASPSEWRLYQFSEQHMGTTFSISCYAPTKPDAKKAADAAFQKAQHIENACSDWTSKSEIRRIMAAPSPQQLSPTLAQVMRHALQIAQLTDGAFDPTIGYHTRNWRRSRISGKLPTTQAIAKATQHTDWKSLKLTGNTLSWNKKNLRIDLGGIAKGYAADKMLEIMQHHGIPRCLITAGGELRIGAAPPQRDGWRIGILNRKDTAPLTLTLKNCAVSTSGDLYQSVLIGDTRYSHIVDPRTGLGLTERISATVIAPLGIHADPLATACCISKPLRKKLLTCQKNTLIHLLIATPQGIKKSAFFPNPMLETCPTRRTPAEAK